MSTITKLIPLIQQLLQEEVGSEVQLTDYQLMKEWLDYYVLIGQLTPSGMKVVIKVARPEAEYDYPFEQTAVWHTLVADQTDIPIADVLAVDTSYQKWPWRYIIIRHIPGEEWVDIRPHLDEQQLADAYRQIGRAVAQLHTIHLPTFGHMTPGGQIQGSDEYLPILRKQANRIIHNPRLQDYFQATLDRYANLFTPVTTAMLCHEDLHQHNILFSQQERGWQLATILDFDKSWAGHHETDLARLDLWTAMTSPDFWSAYRAIHPVAPLYPQRRPIYQLLWCLEYAQPTDKHLADTRHLCQQLGLPLIDTFD